jgi:hypothetical protein
MKDPTILNAFVSGAVALGFAAIALFFLSFWQRTNIRLFGLFALSFLLLTIERIVLVAVNLDNEFEPYVYVIRLTAFLVIIGAIIDHNRRRAEP